MTALSVLVGARIRRVDAPHAELLSIVFAGPEQRGVLLFSFSPGAAGVGIVDERPHGEPATSFVQKLRKELEGARLIAFNQADDATLELVARRGNDQRQLVCQFAVPQIRLLDEAGKELASHTPSSMRPSGARVAWPDSLEELAARGPTLLADGAAGALARRRGQLDKLIRSEHKRLERRLTALAGDVLRAAQAGPLRTQANLLISQLHLVKRGATSVSVVDYTQDPPAPLEIQLDQTRGAKEQVEAWFKQARRFERGAEMALQRRAATLTTLQQLADLLVQLAAADDTALEGLSSTASTLGVRGLGGTQTKGASKPSRQPRHKPYREFRGRAQRTILVGKGAEDNDALTREHARPQDLWLHARDIQGAHVVVPLERNETCPQELLLDAAHLAAHFSGNRGQSIVDVSYTPKRYVRKPRGAPKGQVQLDREKVLTLHPNPTRLTELLATEKRD